MAGKKGSRVAMFTLDEIIIIRYALAVRAETLTSLNNLRFVDDIERMTRDDEIGGIMRVLGKINSMTVGDTL